MKASFLALAALAAAVALPASSQTSVYRWVDKDGKVHFSDAPPAPSESKDVTQKNMGGGGADDTQLPYATQVAVQRNPVSMYTSADCGEPCSQGRKLLADRGIPYAARNPQTNPEAAKRLQELVGALQVPVLTVGQQTLKGYDEGNWHSALDAAGYPRTRLPGQRAAEPEKSAEAGGTK